MKCKGSRIPSLNSSMQSGSFAYGSDPASLTGTPMDNHWHDTSAYLRLLFMIPVEKKAQMSPAFTELGQTRRKGKKEIRGPEVSRTEMGC